jgi:hypothetical protein
MDDSPDTYRPPYFISQAPLQLSETAQISSDWLDRNASADKVTSDDGIVASESEIKVLSPRFASLINRKAKFGTLRKQDLTKEVWLCAHKAR